MDTVYKLLWLKQNDPQKYEATLAAKLQVPVLGDFVRSGDAVHIKTSLNAAAINIVRSNKD